MMGRAEGVHMLRKKRGPEPKDQGPPTVPEPVSAEEKTIIGEKVSIDGSIRGKEDLIIDGSVKGRIELQKCRLTVGAKGQVEAEIQAENVTIMGRLQGNIRATGKVVITKEAEFMGEIRSKGITVEDGAYLKAVIEMEREPEEKAIPAVKSASKTALQVPSESESPSVASQGKKGK
jgi:cytoskeletal protein CcmA (bactofilin family)